MVESEAVNQNYLKTDFNLPAHDNELITAEEVIEKLKLEIANSTETIDGNSHGRMYEQVIKVLDYVGRLSMPAFEIEDKLEELYTQRFANAPELAKELWLEHYKTIHHPYNILKNRCFNLLDELDEMYVKKFKKNPPNWNI